jgi:NDP-sugar pyrophosphorylase family protein
MQIVILAGGLGTRLRPLTEVVPKPMVEVAGAPYLEHQLRSLRDQSLTDVVLCTGYLGEQIERHFRGWDQFGMSIRYSQEPSPMGTGGALKLAAPLIHDDFLLLYGDSYLPIDYHMPWAALTASPAMGVMVVYKDMRGETGVPPNISIDEHGVIRNYDKDSAQDLNYIEAGVIALRREVIDMIPAGEVVSLERDIYPTLIRRGALLGFVTSQRFYDIGTPDRLRAAEDFLRDHH